VTLVILLTAYVVGSVNFSILLFKVLGRNDPRQKFSGNAGATNVYRQAGPFWAATVLAADMARAGLIAALAVHFLARSYVSWVGLALILGNHFPCFHHFNGGKGVANYLGFCAFLTPFWAIFAVCGWAITFYITRTPFLASFTLVAILSMGTIAFGWPNFFAVAGTLSTGLLIIYSHRRNIEEYAAKRR
jgi:glycerol-3-phosphate acyltransferase PlsY